MDFVVITGGFGALGSEVVRLLAKRGTEVAIVDRVEARGDLAGRLTASGNIRVHGGVDISNPDAASRAVRELAAQSGRIDTLVNIAGSFRFEHLADETESWDQLHNVNVKTAVNMCRAAIPFLLESPNASVVNVGANSALNATAGLGAYAASKAAVHKLTEAMADEFRGRIRVNAVLPSVIDTPKNRADMPNADFSHWVSPAAIASVIAFLCTREARAVTGALVPVTGFG